MADRPLPTALRVTYAVMGFILWLLVIAGFAFGDQVTGVEHAPKADQNGVTVVYLVILMIIAVAGGWLISLSTGGED